MKPVAFKEATCEYATNQKEYMPLPAHVDRHGVVTSCWELTKEELEAIAKGKKLYVQCMTFGAALQPILITTELPELKEGRGVHG